MLFNSLHFFLFFPTVVLLYYLVPRGARPALLLLASCYFYMSYIPAYILILLVLILVDYGAGWLLDLMKDQPLPRRRAVLALSLCCNIAFLGFFKYFNFLEANLAWLARQGHLHFALPTLQVVLPIGLSFHTFQSMAYTIEVYRKRQPAERNLLIYALYVLFFPQMVAGPIERPQHLLPQFREHHAFDYDLLAGGLKLMAWGLFKKVLIADRIATFIDPVFSHPRHFAGVPLIVSTYLFAFQIYCDFSGYSDMAIGAAQVLGFRLVDNFNRPYLASSVADFWHRWHISLSTWFRDYLFIPLGGSRVKWRRHLLNIGVVFLVSGLWHGANWTFVAWGALHAVYLMSYVAWRRCGGAALAARWSIHPRAAVLLTFHLVTFAWIFFRASTVSDALYIASHLGSGLASQLLHRPQLGKASWVLSGFVPNGFGVTFDFVVAVAATVVMLLVEAGTALPDMRHLFVHYSARRRWAIYYALTLAILLLGQFEAREFIYFRF